MATSEIETCAEFDHIRYAQLWEDADVLTQGLGDQAGKTLVSICSAGDNALAMLTLDPAKVVVVLNPPAWNWAELLGVLAALCHFFTAVLPWLWPGFSPRTGF